MLSNARGEDMLAGWNNIEVLRYLSAQGSVDGVSRKNTLTEDGLGSELSEQLILNLRILGGFC